MSRKARDRRITAIFLLAWVAWGLALAAIRVRHPGLSIGADWNDAHILVASEWYRTHGHWNTLLIPPRVTAPNPDGTFNLYNTFPPGVFWIHELRRAIGIESLWVHRLAAVVWNQVAVLLLYLLARRITASAMIAAASTCLYMFSGTYATYSGGLWEHLPMLSMLGTLLCWWRFERARRPRAAAGWLAASTVLFAIENLMSVQHTVMIGVILAYRGVVLAIKQRRNDHREQSRRWAWLWPMAAAALVSAAAPVVMLGRFAAQAHIMGGWRQALAYFTDKAEARMGLSELPEGSHGAWGITASRFGIPGFRTLPDSRTLQGWYPAMSESVLIGAAVLLAAAWMVRRSPTLRPARRGLCAGLLLLASAMTWIVLFPQHTMIHTPVTIMFLPGLALVLGTLVALPTFINRAMAVRGSTRSWTPPLLWAGAIAVAAPIVYSLRPSEAINSVARLDSMIADEVAERAARESADRAAAPLVSGATTVWTLSHPITSCFLGVPFYRISTEPVPPLPEPATIVAIRLSEREGRKTLATVSPVWGLPRMLPPPADLALYGLRWEFPPHAARAKLTRPVVEGVQWTEVSVAPTLDGRAWVGCIRLEGKGAIGPYLKSNPRLRLTLSSRSQSASVVAEAEIGEQCARALGLLVAWVQVPMNEAKEWTSAEVSLCLDGEPAVAESLTPGMR